MFVRKKKGCKRKRFRDLHKERLILMWLVFASVLFVISGVQDSPHSTQILEGFFDTLTGSGNVLTGAVIGTQGDVIGIEAAQVGTLGDFYDDFALTPNTTHWYNSTANGGELGWDGSAMNFTAKVTAALPTINFISLENISMASFNLSANITLDNTSATLTEANSHSAISIGVYNNTASGVNSYCGLTIDNSGSFNLHFYNDSGANFLANSTSVDLGPNTNGDILLNFEFNNVTNMVNCSYGTPSGFISITAPTSYIGSDYGVFAYGSTYIIGPGNPTGDLNASIKTFNYTIDVIPETLQDCATITSDTIMDQNVTIDGTCFIAGASDITLDCAGYEINYSNAGTFGYGVNITGYDNVTVKNCVIKEGSATTNQKGAIYSNDANTTIFNNTITVIGLESTGFQFESTATLANISFNMFNCFGGCGASSIKGSNHQVFNNFFNLTGGSQSRGIDVSDGVDSNISQNTVVVDSTTSNGIYVGGSRNLIVNNTVTGSSASAEGIFAYDNGENNTFSENVVNLTGSFSEGLGVNKFSGGNPEGNIFLNNNVSAMGYGFHDELNATNNTIIYNNSFGLINWTKTNLTTQVNLTMGINIFLESENIGFQHEDQDGSGEQLNGTAQLRFLGLSSYTSTPQLLKNGVRCDNGDSCNITFDDTNDILYANVSSFSNYTTQVAGVSCGEITSDTTLTQDLTNGSTCFNITSSHITLNCNGYQINGTSGSSVDAILLHDVKNVTVHSCNIFHFTDAVDFSNGSSNNIYNLSLTNASFSLLSNSENNSFSNISITQTADDAIIMQSTSEGNNFSNLTIWDVSDLSSDGVIFLSTNNNLFDQLTIRDSSVIGIHFNTVNNNILRNSTFTNLTTGVRISSNSANNLIQNVEINVSGNSAISINDDSSASNSLIYNNSFGQINWTNTTFYSTMNFSVGSTIFLENNNVGVLDDGTHMVSANGSSQIGIRGLAYSSTPQLLKNGVRCDTSGLCNITYDQSAGILYANVSSFSNYTTAELSNAAPNVTIFIPLINTIFNVSNVIEIATNVTDDTDASDVRANITFPNGTIEVLILTNGSDHNDKFNLSFTIPASVGEFNVSFIANNSNNHLNNSEFTNFSVFDVVNVSVGSLIPALNSVYNVSNVIEINATVTDDVNVSRVFANVTFPNGTVEQIELGLYDSNIYNTTFIIPAVVGDYNITYFANDSSGNENRTENTNFSVNDVVNVSLGTLVPSVNGAFNLTDTIEINATVIDDVNVSRVFANVTFPNGTVEQLELGINGTSDSYNTTLNAINLTGDYTVTFFANDSSGNENRSESTNFSIVDSEEPTILDLIPVLDASVLTGVTIEVALNVTDNYNLSRAFANITLANGTQEQLELSLDTGHRYNITYTIPSGVNGSYNITFIVNDSSGNFNVANVTNFSVSLVDVDGDGTDDALDTLVGNESTVIVSGISGLNISVDDFGNNGTYSGEHVVTFYDAGFPLINLSHNFSVSGFNFADIVINVSSGSIVVNLSGQGQGVYNKTIFLNSTDKTALCVKDAEISEISEISDACTGNNEIDFTTCVDSSTGVTISGITCIDNGSIFIVSNLGHSGLRNSITVVAKGDSSSSSSSSSGGGGGGGGGGFAGLVLDQGNQDSKPAKPAKSPQVISTTEIKKDAQGEVGAKGKQAIAGQAFFTNFGDLNFDFSQIWLILVSVGLISGMAVATHRTVRWGMRKRHQTHIVKTPGLTVGEKQTHFFGFNGKFGGELDQVNRRLASDYNVHPSQTFRKRVTRLFTGESMSESYLKHELGELQRRMHGYAGEKKRRVKLESQAELGDEILRLDEKLKSVDNHFGSTSNMISVGGKKGKSLLHEELRIRANGPGKKTKINVKKSKRKKRTMINDIVSQEELWALEEEIKKLK